MLWKCLVCVLFLAVTAASSNEKSKEGEALSVLSKLPQQHREKIFLLLSNGTKAQQVAVINDYVDDLLVNLNKFIMEQSLDPVPMPDIEEEFSWRVIFIVYRGEMKLINGWLQGLATMKRNNDVTVSYEYPNLKIRLPLGYDVLMFNYEYLAKFMNIGPKGTLDGKSTNCKFTIDIAINMITLEAKLTRFYLNRVGKISLIFSGATMIGDFIANVFVTVTIPMVKPVLNFIVQSFVTDGLLTVIDTYNDFICKILGNC